MPSGIAIATKSVAPTVTQPCFSGEQVKQRSILVKPILKTRLVMVSSPIQAAQDSHIALVSLLKQYGMSAQVVREMIIDRSIAAIDLSAEDSLRVWQQFYQQHQIESDADLQTWLCDRGLASQHLEYLVTRNLKLERFMQEQWGHQVESYFLKQKAQLDRVIYSLIRVNDANLAQELFFRIQAGEQSLSELASQYSQGSETQTGGLIGPVELSVPHPALAAMLRTSQPGQLLPPTRLADWVVIVRLEKVIPAQLDEAMQQRLLKALFEEWVQAQINQIDQEDSFIQEFLADRSTPA